MEKAAGQQEWELGHHSAKGKDHQFSSWTSESFIKVLASLAPAQGL